MNDGARLTIGEIAQIIHTGDPEFPLQLIDAEVVGWLEIEYVPESLTVLQTEQFECQIEKWVRQHKAASIRTPKELRTRHSQVSSYGVLMVIGSYTQL